jgi:uncharacterized damage-inducible protein DinB
MGGIAMNGALHEHFRRFARYNAWANQRLYRACGHLPASAYYQTRPAFFHSIHGTLSHILVGDQLWFARLRGEPPPHAALDTRPWADFAALHAARQAEDARILASIEGFSESSYGQAIRYQNTSSVEFSQPLGVLLAHIFNHQTHHRGQAHGLLSQTEVAPPELDLIYFIRSESPRGGEPPHQESGPSGGGDQPRQ